MNTNKTTYGNDIELHVMDKTKGRIVSAINLLNCDKYNPIELGNNIKMYADNVLLEAAFPPYNDSDGMINRFRTVFKRIQQVIGDNYKLVPKAAHVYHDEELDCEGAWLVGCNENYNAWKVDVNPVHSFEDGTRTGSIHFHLGNPFLTDFNNRINTVRLLDIYLGLSNVIFDKDESAVVRRNYYGKSSEHRPTPFGLEYRCVGPYAMRSPALLHLCHDLINFTLMKSYEGKAEMIINAFDKEEIISCINTCNVSLAEKLLRKAQLPDSLRKRVFANYSDNFYQEWNL